MDEPNKKDIKYKLLQFKLLIEEKINKKNNASPTYYQLTQYDELVSQVSIYIAQYASNVNNKSEQLVSNLYSKPKDAEKLKSSYKSLNKLIDDLIEDIESNFNFKINENSNPIVVSREYLHLVKANLGEVYSLQSDRSKLVEDIATANKNNSSLLSQIDNFKTQLQETNNLIDAEKTAATNQLESKNEVINKLNVRSNELVQEIEVKTNEIISLRTELGQYKEQTQRTQVARNSTVFQEQANGNKKVAYRWMTAIVIAMTFFVAFLYHMFSSDSELFKVATTIIADSKNIDPILLKQLILVEIGKKIGSKILIVSLLTYIISFLIKNYNAQMHNYVVNSHKANALRSTVDLIGTARGDDGNDKIVLQATQAIFTTQKSGYQGTDSEPTSPNLITNVVDAVSGAKKS